MNKAELIYGEETFLIDEHLERVLKPFNSQDIIRFNEGTPLDKIQMQVSMTSLFCPQNAIVIKNPKWLIHGADDKELDQLTQLITTTIPQQPHTVVIVVYGNVDQRKKAAQLLKKQALISQYSHFKDWEQDKVLQWIQNQVKRHKKTMDSEAALALEHIGGSDLRQMAGEIEKLDIYTGTKTSITKSDVEAMCAPANASMFTFTEAIKAKDLPNAVQALSRLLAHGEDPIKLLGFTVSTFRLYLQILSLSAEKLSPSDIATKIGKNPYFIQRLLPDVKKKYTLAHLQNAYNYLATCDIEIKSGKMKPDVALELAIIHSLSN